MKMTISDSVPAHRPFRLTEWQLPAPLVIAVLAPHPDDFDAIGVTLKRLHEQGHAIHVAVLTTGANGIEDGWKNLYDASAKAMVREAEQQASCDFFGLPSSHLDFLRLWTRSGADSTAESEMQDRESLRAYLRVTNPDLVFLPHGNDSNATHRRTYQAFCEIAAEDKLSVLACLNQDAKTTSMRADMYTCFGEAEAAWKAQLLRFHRSQQERNLASRGHGFDERVLQVNRNAAEKAGVDAPYAEVFELQVFGSA